MIRSIVVTLHDENMTQIRFGEDLHNVKFIGIEFKGCSYKKVDTFLSIIKNECMNKDMVMDKISEIIRSLGYKVFHMNSEFRSTPFKINMVMVSQNNMFQYKVRLNIDMDDCMNSNMDISSIYPTSRLYWNYNREESKRLVDKYLNELSFSFNKEGGENMTRTLPKPKRVICSGPVTTVIYEDGSKTHVRKTEDDQNDYEKAFLLSWLYKTYGKKVVEKKLEEFQEEFKVEEPTKDDDIVISAKAVAKRMNDFLKVSSKKYLG